MSKVSKLKRLVKEFEDLSVPAESQSIVKIIRSCGNNLHEVVDTDGNEYLVSMPTKFRKNIWVKRNDFVLVEPIPEGNKVKAEIVKILTREHKRWYRAQNCWPQEFDETSDSNRGTTGEDGDKNDDLFVNTNRINRNCSIPDNDSDTSSDEFNSSS
ncbi:probable RNA-binding protein EIF1AD [Ceratina calcarata]|uniref:Probable RNA-binding protein EIF1AD n=1 Tax=Ceratina calcarata TaxID=156304 RepID=A0AAJ7N6W3_9HYME|nr:probable RNA-binding protein EIF1AD [Ceratina calcarata]XP_026669512.1 probable RNA-binding protein EIF1AD [Ceratina calcarata]XP_026669513.1 probable RNA-binding protein EIF1AD [Ceratina calcarata]XP_026669514.1 probable RNA-binding protein EIF1AD [Ceratina calcarata]